jgi:two-component system C4-dicarboxylate transport response regulator DctD
MSVTTPSTKPLAYIVDDEPMLLDLNEDILRSIGFEVRRFRAAELALDAYRTAPVPPVIIITDYAMHQMTGLDLIAACRALQPGQKIILVSGTVTDAVFRDAPERPNCFMPKPYTTDELTSAVRRLTGITN